MKATEVLKQDFIKNINSGHSGIIRIIDFIIGFFIFYICNTHYYNIKDFSPVLADVFLLLVCACGIPLLVVIIDDLLKRFFLKVLHN